MRLMLVAREQFGYNWAYAEVREAFCGLSHTMRRDLNSNPGGYRVEFLHPTRAVKIEHLEGFWMLSAV